MDYILEFYKEEDLISKYLSGVSKIFIDGEILTFLNNKKEIIFVVNVKYLSNLYKV